jgi:hypothetical protein
MTYRKPIFNVMHNRNLSLTYCMSIPGEAGYLMGALRGVYRAIPPTEVSHSGNPLQEGVCPEITRREAPG